jgi:two-component system cell cycle sensor histidine kinase/response regulator CckA
MGDPTVPHGDVAELRRTVEDLTAALSDKERELAALRISEERCREIIDGVADVIFEVTLEGTILYCSPSAEGLAGWTPEELVGKTVFDLAVEDDHDRLRSVFKGQASSLPAPREYRIRTRSGTMKWVRAHSRPIIRDGRTVGLRGVMSDIGEPKKTEEYLQEQKEFAESLIETTQVIVMVLTPDGRIVRFNDCMQKSSGYTLDEVKGTPWADTFLPEAVREEKRSLFGVAGGCEGTRQGVIPMATKDGRERVIQWHTCNVKDAIGRITGVLATGMDITDAVRAQEALKESEAKYRAIFENLHDTYFKTDLEDNLLIASPSGQHIFGYKVEEAVGMNLKDFYVDIKKRDEVLKMLSEKGYVREFEAQLRRKDGSVIWVSSNTAFWFDRNGNIGGVEGITRDITERKEAEAKRAALEEQLRQSQKMEAIGTLAGGIAHDFNNLLTSIMGCSNMLKTAMDKEDANYSAVDVIERASIRASELTRQLLGFARKGKVKNTPVDMHEIIGDTIAILRRAIDRTITIEQHLCAARPIVMGDPGQLQQVAMNLAVNARDAMGEGGTLSIETGVETLSEEYCSKHTEVSPGRYLFVRISDTGTGIPEDIRERVFEPFFTTKPTGVGTGMGLATVYGIVKNHGGLVTFDTSEGEGTSFKALFPLCSADVSVADSKTPQKPKKGSGKILVVDDEETVRETVQMMLGMLGYEVDTASNGREAVDYYKEHGAEVRLVILDVTMPKMNGGECYRQLKAIDPKVRVLLSTGHAVQGTAHDLLQAGMVGLVQKPYIAPQLAEAVADALAT